MAATRRLAAIMFTDIVGFTAATQTDEMGALNRLEEHRGLVRPLLIGFNGREIKSTGDGFLVEFESALKATQCAIEIQRRFHERNSKPGVARVELRIGIHLGDVVRSGDDILGDAVNVAARVEPHADPGGVCISQQVFDQVRGKLQLDFDRLSSRELKNIRYPVELYRVVLPWTSGAASGAELRAPRVAVLPFVNFSPDSNDSYFADGLTEELITLLSQVKEIRVIARTSVFAYKSTVKSVSQIGNELGVATVLEGSVRKSRDQVRITVQLIDVASQEHLWSSTYDRKLNDIFVVQTEVAKRVAKALKIELRRAQATEWESRPMPKYDSYLAYLKGRTALGSEWSERAFSAAKTEFERALAIDPRNPRALSGLADALRNLGWGGYQGPRKEVLAKSREYLERALTLEPDLAEAHASLGLALWDEWDFDGAERELGRAIELNPSLASAHQELSEVYQDEGRVDDALRESALAEALDPNSGRIIDTRIQLLVRSGRLDEARTLVERVGKLFPDSPTQHIARAWLGFGEGNYQAIIDGVDRATSLAHEQWGDEYRAWAYGLMGEEDAARKSIRAAEHRERPPINREGLAVAYAVLGDFDKAFEVYFEAARVHDLSLQHTRNATHLEALRKDPRFSELLRLMNLK